jgi:hypothetical protein
MFFGLYSIHRLKVEKFTACMYAGDGFLFPDTDDQSTSYNGGDIDDSDVDNAGSEADGFRSTKNDYKAGRQRDGAIVLWPSWVGLYSICEQHSLPIAQRLCLHACLHSAVVK